MSSDMRRSSSFFSFSKLASSSALYAMALTGADRRWRPLLLTFCELDARFPSISRLTFGVLGCCTATRLLREMFCALCVRFIGVSDFLMICMLLALRMGEASRLRASLTRPSAGEDVSSLEADPD